MSTTSLLKEARARAGLTQKQLADKAGVSNETIVRLERYESTPKAATIQKLASVLGMPFGTLERDFLEGRKRMEQTETKVSIEVRWEEDGREMAEVLRFTGTAIDETERAREVYLTLYDCPGGYRVLVENNWDNTATLYPNYINRYTGETEYPVYDKDDEDELQELVQKFPEFGGTVGVLPVRDLD